MKTAITHHPQQIVTLKATALAFDSFGDNSSPALVLIMGLGAQMIFWDADFCRLLARQGFWVIRLDNRDCGCSSWRNPQPPPSRLQFVAASIMKKPIIPPYSLDEMADDVFELLDRLNVTKAHWVGASMGGMIAQCAAIKIPQRVLSLTSIMSSPGERALMRPHIAVLLKMLQPMPVDPEKAAQHGIALWRLLQGNYYPLEQGRTKSLISQALQRGSNSLGMKRQLAAILAAPDRTAALASVTVPSLVIHGQADPLLPLVNGTATAKALRGAKLVVYPGMGHTLPSQLWPAIVAEIKALAKG